MSRRVTLQALRFGPLPVATINLLLGLELEPGDVVMSAGAQQHSRRRHPEDYPRSLPHVAGVIQDPLFIGDDFANEDKIELIGRPPGWEEGLLVAVVIERDANGEYNVASSYPISEARIQSRREKGFLRNAQGLIKKGPLVA